MLRMQDLMERLEVATATNMQCNDTLTDHKGTTDDLKTAVQVLEAKNEALNLTLTGKFYALHMSIPFK